MTILLLHCARYVAAAKSLRETRFFTYAGRPLTHRIRWLPSSIAVLTGSYCGITSIIVETSQPYPGTQIRTVATEDPTMSWLWQLERKAIDLLLRSPTFHRGVQEVHKRVHRLQHGKPPEYYGGTHIDPAEQPSNGSIGNFFKLFWEELKKGHTPERPPKK